MARSDLAFVPRDNPTLARFGAGDQRKTKQYLLMLAAFLEAKNKNTKRTYRCGIQQFFELFDWVSPEEVTPAHAAAFKKWLIERHGVSEDTAYYRISAVSSFFEYLMKPPGAKEEPLITSNPFKLVDRSDIQPTPYARSKTITWDELELILDMLPSDEGGMRDKAILLFFAFTGRRRAEVSSLTIGDLDLKSRPRTYTVRVKGGKLKKFELPSVVYDALRAYWMASGRLKTLKRDSPVFTPTRASCERFGFDPEKNLDVRHFNWIFDRAARSAEVEIDPGVSIHAIRHMTAQDLDEIGARLQDIQEFLGHANPGTTQIYLKQLRGPPPSWEDQLMEIRKSAAKAGRKAAQE